MLKKRICDIDFPDAVFIFSLLSPLFPLNFSQAHNTEGSRNIFGWRHRSKSQLLWENVMNIYVEQTGLGFYENEIERKVQGLNLSTSEW